MGRVRGANYAQNVLETATRAAADQQPDSIAADEANMLMNMGKNLKSLKCFLARLHCHGPDAKSAP